MKNYLVTFKDGKSQTIPADNWSEARQTVLRQLNRKRMPNGSKITPMGKSNGGPQFSGRYKIHEIKDSPIPLFEIRDTVLDRVRGHADSQEEAETKLAKWEAEA